MSDDHIKSEISLYLSASLTESRNRQIEAHAASCEKCRNALSKARAKLSRIKREALKKASPDRLPNMFLARQGKEIGVDRPTRKFPWLILFLLLLAGGGYRWFRHSSILKRDEPMPSSDPELTVVQTSTTSAPSPVPAQAPAVVEVPKAPKPPVPVLIQQQWQGPDSGVKEARVVVIRNKEGWDKLRSDMQNPLPEVDFAEHVMIGAFTGERAPGTTVSFGKIMEAEDAVYAPYRVQGSTSAIQISSTTAVAPAHPYVLSLLPHIEKRIRLTQKEAAP